jgi:chemotaxis protein MotB
MEIRPLIILKKLIKPVEDIQPVEVRNVEELQSFSEEELEQLIASGKLILYRINDETKALTLILNNDILFETGSTQLKPSLFPILDSVAIFLARSQYMAFIDGHTDNIPPAVHGIYASNDEISFARAKAVVDYLVERGKVPVERLAIGAYGDKLPLGDNSTPAGRTINRRVEITLKPIKNNS